jgi:perosamine synthetase
VTAVAAGHSEEVFVEELAMFGGPPAVTETFPDTLPLNALEYDAVLTSLRQTPLTTVFGGFDVERLERSFAARFGYRHAVAVNSGTSALHAAVAAVGIGPGDEVIVTPHSFVASVSIVVQQGATPVFCDISPHDLGIDPSLCEQLITPRTKAILPVHVYGQPMDIRALRDLCRRRNLRLIEDCAASLGASVAERPVGSFGDVGCFSFNIGKVLRVGEGGMAVTDDPALAELLRELRVNGLSPHRDARSGVATLGYNYTMGVAALGFNYTLNQASAALGWATLERIDELIARRRRFREILLDELRDLPIKSCPVPPDVQPVGYWTSFLLEPDLVPLREAIIRAARSEGVRLFKGFDEPLYRIRYLARYAEGRSFPVTERACARLIAIDPVPFFSESGVRQMAAGLKKVFAHLDQLRKLGPEPGARAR